MRGIGKAFAGVDVLRGVDFELDAGEVHVLAGENGAGKTTLMRILSGVYREDAGAILLSGRTVRFHSAAHASHHGIGMIHQEMSLVPSLSVVDNVFLGRETTRAGVWMNHRAQRAEARRLLAPLGVEVDLSLPVEQLPVSERQLVEIAKSLASRARVIVMDEPTSALNYPEVERLFAIIHDLKARGCGIVFITHKMEEIYRVADRITVLRDGRRVGTARKDELPVGELVKWMVGRELNQQFPRRTHAQGKTRLQVEGFGVPDPTAYRAHLARNVSFSARAGEILGIAGLAGAGNHELLYGLFGGYGGSVKGTVRLDGDVFVPRCPAASVARGVALLTNDRKRDGLVPEMSVVRNLTLASVGRFSPLGWLRPDRERVAAERHRAAMGIRLATLDQAVIELSGGNQQKVALGKWLETRPRVLLLDEPTRGIDVAAKKEIYELMNRWAAEGMAIVLITSELPELLAMADRILVMHRGSVTAELGRGEATQEAVLHAAMGRPAALPPAAGEGRA